MTDYIARDELIHAIDVAVAQEKMSAAAGRSAVAIAEEQPRVKPVRLKAYWTGKGVQRGCSYCGMPIPTTAINGNPLPEEKLHYCYNCGCKMEITE